MCEINNGTFIPKGYQPLLNIHETQNALQIIRTEFKKQLCKRLNLSSVIAPTIIETNSGFQDDLSGKERPVQFDAPPANGKYIQILQDNCKWRHMYLSKHKFAEGSGIYTTLDAGIPTVLDHPIMMIGI